MRVILFVLTALAVVVVTGVVILVVSSTSSGGGRTENEARKVAKQELELTEQMDWCGAWELWTEEGKAAISCEDWGRFLEACDPGLGTPLALISVRVDDDVATVVIERDGVRGSYKMHWEDDQWRWQPSERALADYRIGVDQLIETC